MSLEALCRIGGYLRVYSAHCDYEICESVLTNALSRCIPITEGTRDYDSISSGRSELRRQTLGLQKGHAGRFRCANVLADKMEHDDWVVLPGCCPGISERCHHAVRRGLGDACSSVRYHGDASRVRF